MNFDVSPLHIYIYISPLQIYNAMIGFLNITDVLKQRRIPPLSLISILNAFCAGVQSMTMPWCSLALNTRLLSRPVLAGFVPFRWFLGGGGGGIESF